MFNDPPLHTRVRKLIMGALTPRALDAMEPGLVTLVDRLLDAQRPQATVDLIEDFAAAVPVEIIGNLLGVPRKDRGPLRGWSLAILGALEPCSRRRSCSRRRPCGIPRLSRNARRRARAIPAIPRPTCSRA